MTVQPTLCSATELVNDPVPASTKTHTSFAAWTRVRSTSENPRAAEAVARVLVAPVKSRFQPTPCGDDDAAGAQAGRVHHSRRLLGEVSHCYDRTNSTAAAQRPLQRICRLPGANARLESPQRRNGPTSRRRGTRPSPPRGRLLREPAPLPRRATARVSQRGSWEGTCR